MWFCIFEVRCGCLRNESLAAMGRRRRRRRRRRLGAAGAAAAAALRDVFF
jgi:hypothetical protein